MCEWVYSTSYSFYIIFYSDVVVIAYMFNGSLQQE